MKKKKWPIVVIVIAVIVIIGAAAGGSSAKKVSSSDGASQGVSSNTTPSSDKTTFGIGDTAELKSGKKLSGVIVYEVPSDWKELEVSYSPSFWGKAMTFIVPKN